MSVVGHGELQLLFGFLVALGVYELFELLHLKGGLGALLAGALIGCLLYTSPSPRDATLSRMPSSA